MERYTNKKRKTKTITELHKSERRYRAVAGFYQGILFLRSPLFPLSLYTQKK